MSQRISQLQEVTGALDPNSLLEVAIPNPNSPTGYSSRSVVASKLGGGGSNPFRYTVQVTDLVNDSLPLSSFFVTIPESEFSAVKFEPNDSFDGYSGELNAAIIQSNIMVALYFDGDNDSNSPMMAVVNSDFFYNRTSYNDGNRLRLNNFDNNDGQIYPIRNYSPSPYTDLTGTWAAYPANVTYSEEQGIEIEFRLQTPYSGDGDRSVTGIRAFGYIDMTVMFGVTDNPI